MSEETKKYNEKALVEIAKGEWQLENPRIRTLFRILGGLTFGIGTAVDEYVKIKIQNMRKERLRVFFEQLDKGCIDLTDNRIKNEIRF